MDEHEELEIIEDSGDLSMPDTAAAIKKLKEKIERLETEKKEYLDGWQRAKADLINSKRDEEKRLADWRDRIENNLIPEFLKVLDSFDLALNDEHRKHLTHDVEKGLTLIRTQFMDVLKKIGVDEIDPKGKGFNPYEHEAIEHVEDETPEGTIIQTYQKGYRRGETVLRPARVKVSKGEDKN